MKRLGKPGLDFGSFNSARRTLQGTAKLLGNLVSSPRISLSVITTTTRKDNGGDRSPLLSPPSMSTAHHDQETTYGIYISGELYTFVQVKETAHDTAKEFRNQGLDADVIKVNLLKNFGLA